jgi:hypothetical protein
MKDPKTENSIRIALIQSLEQVPATSWTPSVHGHVEEWLLDRYRNDPNSGVHGSVKWLLLRWGHRAELEQIDSKLAGVVRTEPDFQWRISREGLTLITVDDPRLDRVIEVADTEITVKMFLRYNPSFVYSPEISPEELCPANRVSYYDAAAFCNRLSASEGLRNEDVCYQSIGIDNEADRPAPIYIPLPCHRDLAGFRLPSREEFDVCCSAGTETRRYFGNSDVLLHRYAWTLPDSGGLAHRVASLIPNDLGLFDTLGNQEEWCDRTVIRNAAGRVVADLRGGYSSLTPPSLVDRSSAAEGVRGYWPDHAQGVRVVRTKHLCAKLSSALHSD